MSRAVGSAAPLTIDELIALEASVWTALQRGDAAGDAELLSPDFLGVYPSGFAGRADHADQLGAGPTVADFEIAEPRMTPVGPDHVLLSYRATFRRPAPDSPLESMYVSSLWSQRGDRWVNVFSQDTVASSGEPLP